MRNLIDNAHNVDANLVTVKTWYVAKPSPIRQAMLEQFGYISPKLKDKVVMPTK